MKGECTLVEHLFFSDMPLMKCCHVNDMSPEHTAMAFLYAE